MEEKSTSVKIYIETFPEETQILLNKIRTVILQSAPNSEECISYGMPCYKLNGKPLVYFAGYKNHIGFYATPTGHEKFVSKLTLYKQGKGSVQFPLKQEIPFDLIAEIVVFRISEVLNK